jgi:hypothetical protein
MLGVACLERSRILRADGDVAAARVELAQALQRLQRRPEDARPLRDARALARELGVDHG